MTVLTPLIPDEFEFSPASTDDANKGGANAGVSRAGCTVNEPYYLSETYRLCSGVESPRRGPRSQAGQPTERRTVHTSPYIFEQGDLKAEGANGLISIEVSGKLVTGTDVREVRS